MFKVLTECCEPKRGSKYSACVDLFASEDIVIAAGETKLVGLGVCIGDEREVLYQIFIKDFGMIHDDEDFENWMNSHYLQLMLRSSLGKKGLILPNGVGVIDLDYKDEIKMIIHNPMIIEDKRDPNGRSLFSNKVDVYNKFRINKGDKIAQITLIEHKSYLFGIDSEVERNGGFGSTNKKDGKNV